MPGSQLEIFEDAGHFPFLEGPERFAEVLGRFMDDIEPAQIEFSDEYLDALRRRKDRRRSSDWRMVKTRTVVRPPSTPRSIR